MRSPRVVALLARSGPLGAAIAHLTGVGAVIADVVDDHIPGKLRGRVVNASHVVTARSLDHSEALIASRWFSNTHRLEVEACDPSGRDHRAMARAAARPSTRGRLSWRLRRAHHPLPATLPDRAAAIRATSRSHEPAGAAIALLSPAVGTSNIGDHFIERAITSLLPDNTRFERFDVRSDPRGLAAALGEFDAAILCGTNLYQFDWPLALRPAEVDASSTPIIPFGVGGSSASTTDTDVGALTAVMIRSLHRRCSVGSVRDAQALEIVQRSGADNVLLTGCPVLFSAGLDQLRQPPTSSAGRLVLTARSWLMHVPETRRKRDTTQHRLLAAVFQRFRPEVPMAFVAHEPDDLEIAAALGLSDDDIVGPSEVDAAMAVYSDPTNVVLALRLHAGMLAMSHGLHAIHVGHDSRTFAFADLLGIEAIDLFAPDCEERTLAAVAAALHGARPLATTTSERYAELWERMQEFLIANDLRPSLGDDRGDARPSPR